MADSKITGLTAHVIASGSSYSLWCKVVVGSETFVSKVATIYCP